MSSTEVTPSEPQPIVGKPQAEQAQKATAPAPAPKTAKPPSKEAAEATPPRPHRKAPPAKTASTASDQPERKIAPTERRSRSAEVGEQVQRRERVYREGWPPDEPFAYRGARPHAPPPVYGEEPGEMDPVPFAPPWSYRNRPLAWGPYPSGPYPGMGFRRPGPW